MIKVLLSQDIHPAGKQLLEDKFEVITALDTSQATMINLVKDVDAIILRTASKITKEVINNAPKLKIISRTGAGIDNIDINAASKKGILVCNLPGINNVSVAEHAVAVIMHLAKQLGRMDSAVRNGNWNIRNANLAVEIGGKILGVVGMGKIGSLVAKMCSNFNMRILAYDPYVNEELKEHYEFTSLEELFKESDFITLHCPNTPETKGMITKTLLYSMKPSSYIVNTSRGDVIDEKSLIKILKEKRIAGAGIDVFNKEPVDLNNELLKLDNVVLSPHSAAMTKEATIRAAVEAAKAIIDFFEGRTPQYVYNLNELRD